MVKYTRKGNDLVSYMTASLLFLLLFATLAIPVHADQEEKQSSTVAIVNGEEITKRSLARRAVIQRILLALKGVPEFAKFLMKTKEGQRALDAYRSHVIEKLIEEELILQKAESRGIEVKDREIENRLTTIINRTKEVKNKEELIEKLKKDQRTLEDLKEEIRRKIVREKLRREVVGKVNVSESEIRNHYEKNKDSFRGKDGEVKPLAEEKDHIREKLREDKKEARWKEWLTKVKKEAKIVRDLRD
ncbi:SurA N-terminal domain-containing protein [Candidatus Bipolaricaulota bacterium]|nr:SurA N-terminal domain-containing protein [Candidatus Bipolaricaulota bacterium]